MPLIDSSSSLLLVIDFQSRLMPAIHEADRALSNAGKLLDAARLLDIPVLVTEQNPSGLGETSASLPVGDARRFVKQSFGACAEPGFLDLVPIDTHFVVVGCEAHVCVLQTVMGLLAARRSVHLVQDAVGSRAPENKGAAIERMRAHGSEIVTTEMVVFEWLRSAEHPYFRQVAKLIK